MSCASERQVFEPTSQWASEYIERVREGRRAAFALLIFVKNYVGFHCRTDRSPWASFPWVLASQLLADERWEWHSPWVGRGQGGPSCWMPFPHVASPDKCHQPPKVPPLPTMPSLLSCLAYLQAVKHWGIVGLSFFLSFTWRWVFALRASRNCDSVAGKKENLMLLSSKNALLQLQSSLFVLPAPTPHPFFMYIYHGSYLEKR